MPIRREERRADGIMAGRESSMIRIISKEIERNELERDRF